LQDINLLSGGEINRRTSFVVFINGLVLGIHSQPYVFVSELRSLRRSGRLGEFVAIHIDEKQRCIYISADSGRVCRPLIIVKNGLPLISTRHIRELELGLRSFGDLIIEGRIECAAALAALALAATRSRCCTRHTRVGVLGLALGNGRGGSGALHDDRTATTYGRRSARRYE
jgi:DNA-directed RNA polymerase beta subunit